jgi:hypothetical protein
VRPIDADELKVHLMLSSTIDPRTHKNICYLIDETTELVWDKPTDWNDYYLCNGHWGTKHLQVRYFGKDWPQGCPLCMVRARLSALLTKEQLDAVFKAWDGT